MRHPQHWYFPQFRCNMQKISAKRYRRAKLGVKYKIAVSSAIVKVYIVRTETDMARFDWLLVTYKYWRVNQIWL